MGSRSYPDRPIRSIPMSVYTTLAGMCLLKPQNALHVPSISATSYKDTTDADATFVVRISMEKADGGEILTG